MTDTANVKIRCRTKILIVAVALVPVGFGIWALMPMPSVFQGWADANLILQSFGLGFVMWKGFEAQAFARASGELTIRPSGRQIVGAVGIVLWAILGLAFLLAGGVLKPVHTFIALELGTILPILSYAVAKATGWNGKLGRKTSS